MNPETHDFLTKLIASVGAIGAGSSHTQSTAREKWRSETAELVTERDDFDELLEWATWVDRPRTVATANVAVAIKRAARKLNIVVQERAAADRNRMMMHANFGRF